MKATDVPTDGKTDNAEIAASGTWKTALQNDFGDVAAYELGNKPSTYSAGIDFETE